MTDRYQRDERNFKILKGDHNGFVNPADMYFADIQGAKVRLVSGHVKGLIYNMKEEVNICTITGANDYGYQISGCDRCEFPISFVVERADFEIL